MNRYASNWAWYLGHHWAYKREIGEPQLVFNWVKAFSDYLVNFSFAKGVNFYSPEATAAIIPYCLAGGLGGPQQQAAGAHGVGPAWVGVRGLLRQGGLRAAVHGLWLASPTKAASASSRSTRPSASPSSTPTTAPG